MCQIVEGGMTDLEPYAVRYSSRNEAYEHLIDLGVVSPVDGIGTAILCPWCGINDLQTIRFHDNAYQGYCVDCGWISVRPHHVKPLRMEVGRLVQWITSALRLMGRYQAEELIPNHLWRLGEFEHRRKRRTIFFGRRLEDESVLPELESQILENSAPSRGVLITTTGIDPATFRRAGSVVVPLRAIAHIRKAGLVIENLDAFLDGNPTYVHDSSETSLRLMRSSRIALIKGKQHRMSPQVYQFLCVLEQAAGEPVHKRTLADALEIDVDKCKGSLIFKRHKPIYETFVGHDSRGNYWIHRTFLPDQRR